MLLASPDLAYRLSSPSVMNESSSPLAASLRSCADALSTPPASPPASPVPLPPPLPLPPPRLPPWLSPPCPAPLAPPVPPALAPASFSPVPCAPSADSAPSGSFRASGHVRYATCLTCPWGGAGQWKQCHKRLATVPGGRREHAIEELQAPCSAGKGSGCAPACVHATGSRLTPPWLRKGTRRCRGDARGHQV